MPERHQQVIGGTGGGHVGFDVDEQGLALPEPRAHGTVHRLGAAHPVQLADQVEVSGGGE